MKHDRKVERSCCFFITGVGNLRPQRYNGTPNYSRSQIFPDQAITFWELAVLSYCFEMTIKNIVNHKISALQDRPGQDWITY